CHHAPTPASYALSLHDALPISAQTLASRFHVSAAIDLPAIHRKRARRAVIDSCAQSRLLMGGADNAFGRRASGAAVPRGARGKRSEEHTSELQSRENLVCRLLL